MSTSSIQATSIQDLARTITARFDSNNDGSLSSTEFSGFLSQFLGALRLDPGLGTTGANTQATAAATTGAASTEPRPAVGHMAGFDPSKLADLSHKTFKYQIGRILQHYPNTPAGLRDALPEIQQLVPGAKISGSKGDLLDFGAYNDPKSGRIGVIDVVQAAGLGGVAWQWSPIE